MIKSLSYFISSLAFILSFGTIFSQPEAGKNFKYSISICAMFQDEAPYLREWIEYHLLLGVEHFYLYNNNSDDNFLNVLNPYIKNGVVELTEWSRPNKDDFWLSDQIEAYNHCLQKCVNQTAWLAVIDIDEFIVPVNQPDLYSFLSKYDVQKNVGGLKINWQLYGTSQVSRIKKRQLLIESLVWKAPTDYASLELPNNTQGKSIIRPLAVERIGVHDCTYKPGFGCLPKLGGKKNYRELPIDVSQIRINHYWTRHEEYFFNVKMRRRMIAEGPEYQSVLLKKLEELNQVKDTMIFKYVPELRKRMNLKR